MLFYSDMIKKTLTLNEDIKEMAEKLHHQKSLIVMGRGFNFATCLEGALVRIFSCNCTIIHFQNQIPVNLIFFFPRTTAR